MARLVGSLVVVAAALALAAPARATYPGDNGPLYFTRYTGIYAVQADGQGVRPIFSTTGVAQKVSVSADGQTLAYERDQGIWVVGADGSGDHPVVPGSSGHYAYWPSVSPDGRRVLYSIDNALWMVDSDGSDAHVVVPRPGAYGHVSQGFFTPDGRRIVYGTAPDYDTPMTIWTAADDGTGAVAVITGGEPSDVSPDGRSILYRGGNAVRFVDLDGSGDRLVIADPTNEVELTDAHFSPDGTRITYLSSNYYPNPEQPSRDVYMAGLDGSGAHELLQGAWAPAWAPLPHVDITSGPAGTTASRVATFTFSSAADGAEYECSLDGAAFSACASGIAFSDLPDGPHSFRVRAHVADRAPGDAARRDWVVDTRPPGLAPPPAATYALPEPVVRVRIRRLGHRRFALVFTRRAVPGDVLTLYEASSRGRHLIVRTTRARGTVRFRAMRRLGPRRRILAITRRGGVVRSRAYVARFRL